MAKPRTTPSPRAKRDSDRYATPQDLRSLLLWARKSGFRIREVEADGVRLVLDDLRIHDAADAVPAKTPRTIHEQWSAALGIEVPDDEAEDML